jgi:putative redox protein
MNAQVIWKGKMSFEGSSDSGFTLPLGADPEVGGDEDGFEPLELFAIGLAGCTAMDVISILKKKRQDITHFEVYVDADRTTDHPKVFTHVRVEYIVQGHQVDPVAVERAIELSSTKYCPAQAMLAKAVEIELKYVIRESPK